MKANKEREEMWRSRIDEYHKSGLSARVWCSQNNIPVSTLGYWLTRFKKIDNVDKSEVQWAEVAFVESDAAHESLISIHIGAARIEVSGGFDAIFLAEVLKVAASVC